MLEKKNKHNMKKKLIMLISCVAFGCTNRHKEIQLNIQTKKYFFMCKVELVEQG